MTDKLLDLPKRIGVDPARFPDRPCYFTLEITREGNYIVKPFKPYLIIDNAKPESVE